jgi:O-antigen/teichoic acid export membrane protein
LGVYTFGYNLILLPLSAINGAIGAYLFPKYSAMRERIAEIRPSYLGIIKITLSSLTPVIIIFSQFADIIIKYIWGEVWIEAIPIIQALCIVAFLGILIAPTGQLMKSFGKPEWLLGWSIFSVSLSSILIFIGIKNAGLIGVSFGLAFSCILSLPVIIAVLNKLIHVNVNSLFIPLKSIFMASIFMLVVFFTGKASGYTDSFALVVTTLFALLGYISLIMFLDECARNTVKLFFSGERRLVTLIKTYALVN